MTNEHRKVYNPLGIHLVPDQGMVFWCDFEGFRPGEIGAKVRPVVVLSPAAANSHTVLVAPITQAGWRTTQFDICIQDDCCAFFECGDRWVKPQLITHVERRRLGRMLVAGRPSVPIVHQQDLHRILSAVGSLFTAPIAKAA